MQTEPRNIIQSFLGRENLSEAPRDEVRRLAEKYPYSPLIQYLLTKKLQLSGDPGYGDSVGRTALYFHNPHWLSLLLRRQTSDERMSVLEESLGLADAESPAAATDDMQIAEERLDESPAEMIKETPDEVRLPDAKEETSDSEQDETQGLTDDTPLSSTFEDAADVPASEGAGYLQSAQDEQAPAMETNGYGQTSVADAPTGPEETDNDDDASPAVDASSPGHGVPSVAEALGETEDVIPIQPLHTLDYFASLGVSLEPETPTPADSKVLSFPEWLRSMKPIHPSKKSGAEAVLPAEDGSEEGSEDSNEVEEILTEAMAEVFAKQGLRLKAIDIYRKLSLLHPDKSSIFAARIDQLKGIAS